VAAVTVAAIRGGLVTALETVIDRVYDFPYAQPVPPMANVALDDLQYDEAMQGAADRYRFVVRLLVGRADDRSAVIELDPYLASVPAAINADHTLGGACDSARVEEARNYGVYVVAETNLLGVEFVIDVIA